MKLFSALQIDSRTLKRWRHWWLDNFVRSSFWKAARARFMPLVCEQTLPLSSWLSFELEERDRLLRAKLGRLTFNSTLNWLLASVSLDSNT